MGYQVIQTHSVREDGHYSSCQFELYTLPITIGHNEGASVIIGEEEIVANCS